MLMDPIPNGLMSSKMKIWRILIYFKSLRELTQVDLPQPQESTLLVEAWVLTRIEQSLFQQWPKVGNSLATESCPLKWRRINSNRSIVLAVSSTGVYPQASSVVRSNPSCCHQKAQPTVANVVNFTWLRNPSVALVVPRRELKLRLSRLSEKLVSSTGWINQFLTYLSVCVKYPRGSLIFWIQTHFI
jgi:hypothetical protein